MCYVVNVAVHIDVIVVVVCFVLVLVVVLVEGTHFGRFMVPSGGLLGALLTPQNTPGKP